MNFKTLVIFISIILFSIFIFLVWRIKQTQTEPISQVVEAPRQINPEAVLIDNYGISQPEVQPSGEKYVTVTGTIVGTLRDGNKNIVRLKLESVPNKPTITIDLGPDNLISTYVANSISGAGSNSIKSQTYQPLTTSEIYTKLQLNVNKSTKLKILIDAPFNSNDPLCVEECQLLLKELTAYKTQNKNLIESSSNLDKTKFGAILEIHEPYE
jgi:hypothetical protein